MIATATLAPTCEPVPVDLLRVLDGVDLRGNVNVDETQLIANIAGSIRRGFQQVQLEPIKSDHVLLVGSGPSLKWTDHELFELYYAGAKIVTVNGGYHWCLAHHLKVSAQIVVDARPGNGRFLSPVVPHCQYLVASQCDPSTWDAVDDGRENVWIWHAVDAEGTFKDVLNGYYFNCWTPIGGGTTVAMRGLSLLRSLGYIRFDLFGIDSCWMDGDHHSIDQPENAKDHAFVFAAFPTGHPERTREFTVSPWHLKQLEDFLQLVKLNGDQFLIHVHGDGLLAFTLQEAAALEGTLTVCD